MSQILFILCFILIKTCLQGDEVLVDRVLVPSFTNNSVSSSRDSLIEEVNESGSAVTNKIFPLDESIPSPSLDSSFLPLNPNISNEPSKEAKNSSLSKEHQKTHVTKEVPIVIVIPSYNNADWYVSNLDSVLMQNYKNYRIIYINDCSTDETSRCVEEKIKRRGLDYRIVSFDCSSGDEDIPTTTKRFTDLVNQERHFFTLINNSKRSGCLANSYRAIYSCQDNEIIGILDGDDWFLHSEVLQEIHELYSKRNIWLTHGRFLEYPHGVSAWNMIVPEEIVKYNAFRYYRLPSHFRTFYTWLFKKIRLDDLLYQGNFYPMTGDMAMMFPMIEMAGERHAYIDKINYVYNMANELNDNKQNALLQRELDAHIRGLPFYHRIENDNLTSTKLEQAN